MSPFRFWEYAYIGLSISFMLSYIYYYFTDDAKLLALTAKYIRWITISCLVSTSIFWFVLRTRQA